MKLKRTLSTLRTMWRTTIYCALLVSFTANYFAYEAPIRAHLQAMRDVKHYNPMDMAAMDEDFYTPRPKHHR